MLRLKARVRKKTGKGEAKKIRKKGNIPATLYGKKVKGGLPLEIEKGEFQKFLKEKKGEGRVFIIEIEDEGKKEEHEVVVKETQWDWLEESLQHIDFYKITAGRKIGVRIPLNFVGKARGEKEGGIVEHLAREVEVEALPSQIPSSLEVDITNLGIGDFLTVKDIPCPQGVKILSPPEEVVVTVLSPVTEEEVEKLEEEKVTPTPEVEVVKKKVEKEEEVFPPEKPAEQEEKK